MSVIVEGGEAGGGKIEGIFGTTKTFSFKLSLFSKNFLESFTEIVKIYL